MKRRTLLKLIGIVVAVEAASCTILHLTHHLPTATQPQVLPQYLSWDAKTQTTELKPNLKLTYDSLIKDLIKANWHGNAALLDFELALNNVQRDSTGLETTPQGLRTTADVEQPEFTILALGDSVTYGTLQGRTYPDFLQEALQEATKANIKVLNAGIEGHTTRDALNRLPKLDALTPDLVVVYLGLNDLYQLRPTAYGLPSFTLRLVSKVLPQKVAQLGEKGIFAGLNKWRMGMYTPPAVANIRAITKHYQSKGIKVVLVAPMMLVDTPQSPLEATKVKIANSMPTWTNDPEILAIDNQRLRAGINNIAADLGADVINAPDWLALTSEHQNALVDNVHLSSSGARAFAQYLAQGMWHTVQTLVNDKQNQQAAAEQQPEPEE